MKILISLMILFCMLIPSLSHADCWNKRQDEITELKKKLITTIEQLPISEWKVTSSDEIFYRKVVGKNGHAKEITISINSYGTLYIESKSVDLSDYLQKRVLNLYRNVICTKMTDELAIIKLLLGEVDAPKAPQKSE